MAGEFPIGQLQLLQQQQLAIARALAFGPKLLMLDEPTEGIQPSIIKDIGRVIRMLADRGDMAILLVEQRVAEALSSCDHGYVLQTGRIALEGVPSVLMEDPHVKEIYLGM